MAGVNVPIKNPSISDEEHTYLISAGTASCTELLVADYEGFSANDYLVLGPYGKEKTEIIQLDSTPTSTELKPKILPKYAHPANTLVTKISWNQVEISSSASETGTFAVLSTGTLEVDDEYTYYRDSSGKSSTWYKVRFYNVNSATYSDYSDAVQAAGYKANSRGRLKNMVISLFGDKNEKWVTDDDLNNFFYQIENEVFDHKKRWTFLQAGTTFSLVEGQHEYDLTSGSAFLSGMVAPEKKYLENIWLGDSNPLAYKDRKEMDSLINGLDYTTLTAEASSGATSLTVQDTTALASSGTVVIEGDHIPYTTIDGLNTLTGVSGVDSGHLFGKEVWQSDELDEPTTYTIWDGKLIFNVAPDTIYTAHAKYWEAGTPMSEDNEVSQIPWASSIVVDGVLSLCYAAKQDMETYRLKRAEFENKLKEKGYAERSGQKQSLTPSDDESYQEWRDYKDFDKGDLFWVKNKYKTS